MNALVTGGGGFLGTAIVERLRNRGDAVRVLARGDYPELRQRGAETLRGDIADRDAVERACAGVDAVFHAAALPGIWGSWKRFFRTNVIGTQNVLAGCRRHCVRKLIYTSSPSVVFDARRAMHVAGADESCPYPRRFGCHYSATKALAERMVLGANDPDGLMTVALRPHLIWGPGDNHLIPRLLDRARAGRLIRVGDGTNRVDLTYVDNAAKAHLLASDRLEPGSLALGNAYFISDGQPVMLWNWIGTLLERAGLPPVKRAVSNRAAYAAGIALESIYSLLRLRGEPRMTRFLAGQLAGDHFFDITRARADLGFEPDVDNETGMNRLVDWLQDA